MMPLILHTGTFARSEEPRLLAIFSFPLLHELGKPDFPHILFIQEKETATSSRVFRKIMNQHFSGPTVKVSVSVHHLSRASLYLAGLMNGTDISPKYRTLGIKILLQAPKLFLDPLSYLYLIFLYFFFI